MDIRLNVFVLCSQSAGWCHFVQMTYQSRQWCGQYVIASRPDVFGVCHFEAGNDSEKITMVYDGLFV